MIPDAEDAVWVKQIWPMMLRRSDRVGGVLLLHLVVWLSCSTEATPIDGRTSEERCRAKMSFDGDWTVLTGPPVTKEQAQVCRLGDGQPCTPIGITRYLSTDEIKLAFTKFGKVVRVGHGLDAHADICVDTTKRLGDGGRGTGILVPFVRFRRVNVDL